MNQTVNISMPTRETLVRRYSVIDIYYVFQLAKKYTDREIGGEKVQAAKCPSVGISSGEISCGEMSGGELSGGEKSLNRRQKFAT